MAKIKMKKRGLTSFRPPRKVSASVTFSRTGQAGDGAVQACVNIGREQSTRILTGGPRTSSRDSALQRSIARGAGACATGKNPRSALSNALEAVAKKLRDRSGSIFGLFL